MRAQDDELFRSWNQPFTPFRVIGNVYYVGANEIASFLITSSEGHILLDGGFKETVPIIRDNIRKLGSQVAEVKILLNSHAHLDHAGGLAELKALTGAKLMIMQGDVEEVTTGGKKSGPEFAFPPVAVDHVLSDGEVVRLGESALTAHLTPGHTRGNTTWSLRVTDEDETYDVVVAGSPNVLPGVRLVDNPAYPNIAQDFEKTFRVLRGLYCDVFLGGHGSFFFLEKKHDQLSDGTGNPFIDPDGYKKFVEHKEQVFLQKLQEQQQRKIE